MLILASFALLFGCCIGQGPETTTADASIDACLDKTCKNGGTCFKRWADFAECICPPGFYGSSCEKIGQEPTTAPKPTTPRPDPCLSNPCQNGGTCDGTESAFYVFQCYCTQDYTGDKCQIKVANPPTCIHMDVDFQWNDLKKLPDIPSYASCNNMCKSYKECQFWTWERKKKNCWLKNSDTGLPGGAIGTPTRDYDCVSGFKVCPVGMKYLYTSKTWVISNTTDTYHGCNTFVGIDFWELNNLKSLTNVYYVHDCRNLCQGTQQCQYWTYHITEHKCWLKQSETGLPNHAKEPVLYSTHNVVSGFRDCTAGYVNLVSSRTYLN